MSTDRNILIVDDEESILWVFTKALEDSAYSVDTATSGEDALEKIRSRNYMLVFTDIFMPGISGLDLLKQIQGHSPAPHVVVMTAQDTMNNTIEAMKHGAFDYLSKPFQIDEVLELIERVRKSRDVPVPDAPSPATQTEGISLESIVGKTRAMQEIFKTIGKAAATQLPVLITGESGTGKELVAHALHYYSDRSAKPFLFINCAAIARDLLESELFGHEKGSFTGAVESKQGKFELAHGGTLLLDEIGDMEPALQAKILRVLQNHEFYRVGAKEPTRVDVRVIAATHQDLPVRIKENHFREDLFHRLNVVNIHLPPLRERKDDILLLANFFVDKYSDELTQGKVFLSPESEQWLKHYSWPGNIRELENAVRRAMVLTSQGPILKEHLPPSLFEDQNTDASPATWDEGLQALVQVFLNRHGEAETGELYDHLIQSVEKHLFEQLLEKFRGNQVATAKALGINRNTLKRKIDAMNIEPKKGRTKSNGDSA